eukprot:TRINITY_DN9307_c0_g1_i1.p1 TRINITY_DN9307_c0_g1~~TRINITY_DN9307_c0_g1_i1.p1  ORF type:complete len:138 (-),score=14.05 TRINITY_DN9307_c0_g1_i1:131-544(-)
MKIEEDSSPLELVVSDTPPKSPVLRPLPDPADDMTFLQLSPDASFSCRSSTDSSDERDHSEESPLRGLSDKGNVLRARNGWEDGWISGCESITDICLKEWTESCGEASLCCCQDEFGRSFSSVRRVASAVYLSCRNN